MPFLGENSFLSIKKTNKGKQGKKNKKKIRRV